MLHNVLLHEAPHAHLNLCNCFSRSFYHKTQTGVHSMFAFVVWQNIRVSPVSPIHSFSILHLLAMPRAICLYPLLRSRLLRLQYIFFLSTVPCCSMLPGFVFAIPSTKIFTNIINVKI